MAETDEGDDKLDPADSKQITVVGRKGSGKTELAYLFFDEYPFDRLAIDPNRDLKMPDEHLELASPVPTHWPGEAFNRARERAGWKDDKRQTLYYPPDFYEADYREEMDRALGMAFAHRRTCVFFDECHEGAPATGTPPHMRRALRHGRHQDLFLILATPRPMTVDPLVITQADYLYVFDLPGKNDRKRVAENIGWNALDFDDAVLALPEFGYLRYDAAKKDLAEFPPLPSSIIRHHKG
jgi:hypothetical protein